jgi:hypothetical protein
LSSSCSDHVERLKLTLGKFSDLPGKYDEVITELIAERNEAGREPRDSEKGTGLNGLVIS